MFESKRTPGKKFGSSFVGKKYDENHSESGMHKLGGEEPHELGQDKVGEGAKTVSTKTPSSNKAMSRTDDEGEAKFSNKEASKGVPDADPKAMDMDEGSPDVDADPEKSRTDEEGESTGEDTVPDDVKDAAMQHGPAHTVTVKHDSATGRHTVTSHHSTGHTHMSTHPTAQAAHASAKHLGMPKQESPDDDGEDYSHLLG